MALVNSTVSLQMERIWLMFTLFLVTCWSNVDVSVCDFEILECMAGINFALVWSMQR